jgi:hypothetical protein
MKFILTLTISILLTSLHAQTDSLRKDSLLKKFNQSRLSFGPDISLGYCFRKIESKLYPEMVACRNEHEQAAYLPHAGIAFHYRITNWFQLVSGIRYLQTGFNFKEERQLSDTLETELGSACDVYHVVDPAWGYLVSGFLDPRYGFLIKGEHPDTATLKFQVRYHYIDVPLKARFSLEKKLIFHKAKRPVVSSISLFVYAGISINYLFRQNISYQFENNGTEFASNTYSGKPFDNIEKINYSLLTGGGIRYRATQKVAFEVHADAQWQQINIFQPDKYYRKYYIEKHYRYDAGLSVFYYFAG